MKLCLGASVQSVGESMGGGVELRKRAQEQEPATLPEIPWLRVDRELGVTVDEALLAAAPSSSASLS